MDIVAGSSRAVAAERRPIRHLDLMLLVIAGLLSAAGIALIYSANRSLAAIDLDPTVNVKKQIAGIAIGVVLLLLIVAFDYRFLKVYAGLFYGITLLGLILVQTPLGTNVNGAQRWFQFAGFQLSPAEFAKLSLIGLLAAMFSEIKHRDMELSDVIRGVAVAVPPMVFVFIQPDIGTSIVVAAILVGVLVVAGAKAKHLIAIGLTAVILAVGAFQLGVIKDYQVERLTA
ncbi:MAG: FtsW/RodA/SpoVE family cell cycle protein, partial [Actinomycetota bacterium]